MSNLNVFNPYTDELISSEVMLSKKEALSKLSEAYDIHKKNTNGISKKNRIEILENFYQLLQKNSQEIIELSVSEGGKPIQDSQIEMQRALEGVKLGIQSIRNLNGEMIPMSLNSASSNKLAFTTKSPIGVVFSISAFNHPINLTIHQIIPCIINNLPFLYFLFFASRNP